MNLSELSVCRWESWPQFHAKHRASTYYSLNGPCCILLPVFTHFVSCRQYNSRLSEGITVIVFGKLQKSVDFSWSDKHFEVTIRVADKNRFLKTEKIRSRCFAKAALQHLLTGIIPLLDSTGDLTCFVSDLGRFTPP